MANNRVLSIDITNESITIVEITASQKKQTYIHKVLIFETPEDSFDDGNIRDLNRIGTEIRTQLASAGISNKNAVFVMNSTKIVNREVVIPSVAEKKVAQLINSNASEYFPVGNIQDYVIETTVLENFTDENGAKQMRVMAVAAPEMMVRGYYDLAQAAGLKVVALDYIGNAMLQLIKTQTTEQSTTMVIQLGAESTVLNVVNGDKLLLQRTVPYGTNPVVNVVMQEKGVDATTAMTMLQNERIITVDFDDNEATGAFRYLINNIGRVMDFYASKNPDNPIDDVFLTGDGALIRGIDGLFKIQLNVSTRIMDSLYNVKFDPSIDLRIYSPVYLIAPIGGALNPMGFALSGGAGGKSKSGSGIAPFAAILIVSALVAAGAAFYFISKENALKTKKASLERQIEEKAYIEEIIAARDAAEARAVDVKNMDLGTYQLNEQCLEFVNNLEAKIPTNVVVQSFSSSNESISIPAVAPTYDDIADFIMQLKTISCIDDVYVSSVALSKTEDGKTEYAFTCTCVYTNPNASLTDAEEE
ncbi:type IV pilus assembly protein PilM [Lachnospiraceae bacterium NE2001]|nr:type IV pilus assembly protein PilM [Lachnospiraceae bacterium NE2001]